MKEYEKINKLELPKYEKKEENLNILSHFIGSIFGFTGLILMIVKASKLNNVVLMLSVILYGLTFIELFLMSTIYHATKNEKLRIKTQKGDHLSINFFIFGSVNIFLSGGVRTNLAYILSGVCFILSVISIVLNSINVKKYRTPSMLIYITTGWLPIFVIKEIYSKLGLNGMLLLLLGGITYTIGLIFYAIKKKYMHFIWHIFVLIAAILMFFSVYFYVII